MIQTRAFLCSVIMSSKKKNQSARCLVSFIFHILHYFICKTLSFQALADQDKSKQSSPTAAVVSVAAKDQDLTKATNLVNTATAAKTSGAGSRSDSAYAPVAPAPLGPKFNRPKVRFRRETIFE